MTSTETKWLGQFDLSKTPVSTFKIPLICSIFDVVGLLWLRSTSFMYVIHNCISPVTSGTDITFLFSGYRLV